MFKFLGVLIIMTMFNATVTVAETISLTRPDITGETGTLMSALANRQSIKDFADKELDSVELGGLLWAAYGVNRPDGHRTIPTAMNEHDLDVYVFRHDGIWRYDADQHALTSVSHTDRRDLFRTQPYMTKAPVVLVYTGSAQDYAAMHAGSAYQNVGLYAASRGLANVVRGYFDANAIARVLNLDKNQRVIVSQAVGYPNS